MEKPKPVPRSRNPPRNPRNESPNSSQSQSPDIEELKYNPQRLSSPSPKRRNKSPPKSLSPTKASHSSSSQRRIKGERLRSSTRDPLPPQDEDNNSPDLRRQIERLERDLQRRDRELEEERVETERCMEMVKRLERDKVELKREVEGLKDESDDYKRTLDEYKERSRSKLRKGQEESEEGDGYDTDVNQNVRLQNSYEISLQQKNRDIEQFLEDNERLEEEKKSLEEKLNVLKDSLGEATKQIEIMANDHFQFKSKMQKANERTKELEEDNAILSIRERELLGFKERHEQYLENLCNAVDIRVDVWKKMMFEKDEEIDRLNAKIQALMNQIPNTQLDSERSNIQVLNKKLAEREHQIEILNDQLSQATLEIESSTSVIKTLQQKLSLTQDSKKTEQLVKTLQSSCKKLEEKLERKTKELSGVEKEAEEKSRALTSLMSRMTSYEKGEYGLAEAVSEIKDLKIQIRIRDKQVEGVTGEINVLQMQVSDLQEENEMLRAKLGVESEADVSRETRRYTRSMKNELSALRSKVLELNEELVTVKTKNYSLNKMLGQWENQIGQQPSLGGSFVPERDREGPEGGSVASTDPVVNQGDMFVRNLTGVGIKGEEWKDKYEIILKENAALRRGLHEILDCMHKMTDDGNTEVMIQAPVLEELLREMSARGIINYPFPITTFHMKVCNLEGQCSQLREELHRLRQEERSCRQSLFEAQVTIKTLSDQLSSPPEEECRPQRSSASSASTKHVTFRGQSDETTKEMETIERKLSSTTSLISMSPGLVGRNLVLEDLQNQVELLQSENSSLKEKLEQEKTQTLSQLEHLMNQANALIISQKEPEDRAQLKIEYLQAVKENRENEINSLLKKLSLIENENSARLNFLERFKLKAFHQIQTFQQILETSVPIHLLHNAKKDIRILSDKVEDLKGKEEAFTIKSIAYHKNSEEISGLRKERDKLEEELSKFQARLIETSAKLEVQNEANVSHPGEPSSSKSAPLITLESQNIDLTQKLNHSTKMNNLIKGQIEEMETSRIKLEQQLGNISEKYSQAQNAQKEAEEKCLDSVPREEYDLLVNKLVTVEENLILSKDEQLKWKEMAEMTQNQIRALENIKDFEKMELDRLSEQVMELQSESNEKALLAKVHLHMLSADKEKHLAIQQVQKLLSKLCQLEAHSVQQEKVHQEREMTLISMHTHVIMRYRNLFAALHDMQTPRFSGIKLGNEGMSQDVKEAFEMFERTEKKCVELEDEILEERLKAEEFEEKCGILEIAINSLRDGSTQDLVFELMQKVQEARVEVARWKRKSEQKERDCLSLTESVHRLESKTSELEDDRIKLEHTLELKESLTSTLMAKSVEQLQLQLVPQVITPVQTLSSTSMPLLSVSSTRFETFSKQDQECQVGTSDGNFEALENLKIRVAELEGSLRAKDEALSEIRFIRAQQVEKMPSQADSELEDALSVARDTIKSLQERLKSKDDSVHQYRRLLADVRSEMTTSTERHVQEMRALQMTIHQQQQAFTRMKSTLSQPVKDTLNVEGTIKDQLTQIHELEDEVSQLQHAMSNTAAQLTAARSEAHRWRCNAEAKIKEVDSARDQHQNSLESLEELNSVRMELRETKKRLEDSLQQLNSLKGSSSARESMTDLVNVLRIELEEKDKQIEAYSKSLHNLKSSGTFSEKNTLEEKLHSTEAQVDQLRDEIRELHKTVSSQQVKISKTKAVNYKTGVSSELETLRTKHRELLEEKAKVDKDLIDLNKKRDEEEIKKIKSAEHIARWEESKKWKKNLEKAENRIRELESENEKFKRTMENLRITITRMEKEKIILETKLNSKLNSRSNSASTATDRFSSDLTQASQQTSILAQGEIARLKIEIQDLQELNEKIEFEGREEAEKLKMEVKLLKERIIMQERQLTAYQIAQKGDSKVIAEIENMATRETQFQKEIRRLEEDNLHLQLQMEELRLDTPRLRDRVQHLQKLVEALKTEKPTNQDAPHLKSKKSLSELEKTINALKIVIDKLQSENKRLKQRPSSHTSSDKLKNSVEQMMEDKKHLIEKVEHLEHENEKLTKKFLESSGKIQSIENKQLDAEKRAKSSEMKLRTFLDNANKNPPTEIPSGGNLCLKFNSIFGVDVPASSSSATGYDNLVQKMNSMQEDLDHKNRLLSAAKQSLRAAEKATAPKPVVSPRTRDDLNLPPMSSSGNSTSDK